MLSCTCYYRRVAELSVTVVLAGAQWAESLVLLLPGAKLAVLQSRTSVLNGVLPAGAEMCCWRILYGKIR